MTKKTYLFNLFMQGLNFIILFIDKVEQCKVLVLCFNESLHQ